MGIQLQKQLININDVWSKLAQNGFEYPRYNADMYIYLYESTF